MSGSAAAVMTKPAFRKVEWLKRDIDVERRGDGTVVLKSRIPPAPVSPAYSLMSHDHVKLKYLFDLIQPAVVMVQDGPTFEKALKALDLTAVTVVHVVRPCDGINSISFAELAATPVSAAVA